MPGKIIGTTKALPLAERAQSILKVNGNFSFFAIPTPILEKYGIDSFDIILNENKIMLLAPNGTEQATEDLTSAKMETTDDKSTT